VGLNDSERLLIDKGGLKHWILQDSDDSYGTRMGAISTCVQPARPQPLAIRAKRGAS
jgi:hypothetical protein